MVPIILSNAACMRGKSKRRQGILWMCTAPHHRFTPYLPCECKWIRGQLECGDGGYLHWQFIVGLRNKGSLSTLQRLFGTELHYELSRSSAASEYVWKEDTRVEGTQFELGCQPVDPSQPTDWDMVWENAAVGNFATIPSGIRVRSYHALRSIRADYARTEAMARTCFVFWGATGTGKSHRAWEEAGVSAYSKDPRSKFWCGYGGETEVVIDEFRGGIDISHLLRWTDQYPVRVELKGSAVSLRAQKIWITSNLDPRSWYPDLDEETVSALMRRLIVTHFGEPFGGFRL